MRWVFTVEVLMSMLIILTCVSFARSDDYQLKASLAAAEDLKSIVDSEFKEGRMTLRQVNVSYRDILTTMADIEARHLKRFLSQSREADAHVSLFRLYFKITGEYGDAEKKLIRAIEIGEEAIDKLDALLRAATECQIDARRLYEMGREHIHDKLGICKGDLSKEELEKVVDKVFGAKEDLQALGLLDARRDIRGLKSVLEEDEYNMMRPTALDSIFNLLNLMVVVGLILAFSWTWKRSRKRWGAKRWGADVDLDDENSDVS